MTYCIYNKTAVSAVCISGPIDARFASLSAHQYGYMGMDEKEDSVLEAQNDVGGRHSLPVDSMGTPLEDIPTTTVSLQDDQA